jgi:hypothetical protein
MKTSIASTGISFEVTYDDRFDTFEIAKCSRCTSGARMNKALLLNGYNSQTNSQTIEE